MNLNTNELIQELFPIESIDSAKFEIITNELNFCIRNISDQSGLIFFTRQDRLQYLKNSKKISLLQYKQLKSLFSVSIKDISIQTDLERSSHLDVGIELISFFRSILKGVEIQFEKNDLDIGHKILTSDKTFWKEVRANLIQINDTFLEILIQDKTEDINILIHFENIDKVWISQLKKVFQIVKASAPVYLHSLAKINEAWTFESIVIFPDYLIDVTSISETYDPKASSVMRQFVNLFNQKLTTKSILVGTAVNEFFDELVVNSKFEYKELLRNFFQKNALGLSSLEEDEFKDFLNATELHFQHLKKIIDNKFNSTIQDYSKCLLEPSFYSVKYGIQGRLDLLFQKENKNLVIELKSGKPYQVNSEGISAGHHAQACLYCMLLESIYGEAYQNHAAILYSALSQDQIRKAIDQKSLRRRLLEIRNSLVLVHIHLSYIHPKQETFIDLLNENSFARSNRFTQRDGMLWYNNYSLLSEIEKKYVKYFSYFISREQLLSKCGMEGSQQGLATMWLLSQSEKELQYSIIPNLIIVDVIRSSDDTPLIKLKNSLSQSSISQFRIGDTLILYPQTEDGLGMLQSMVYKCSLVAVEPDHFQIRLRGKQFRDKDQQSFKIWALESDTMDRPFLYQYASLSEWMSSSKIYRNRILGIFNKINSQQTIRQQEDIEHLCDRIVEVTDYFLLWGPPGSGKTSIVIHKLIELLLKKNDESILLLAYTNRAVDEICQVIENISEKNNYIRIGSRYGTQNRFHSRLLDQQLMKIKNRKELKQLLTETRIFVATISSIHGKAELFKLKQFETVIIDEASQILEPNLVGLLSRFKKFIMIGDHLQLPAVCAQTDQQCEIIDQELNELGIKRMNESLFERMYRQAQEHQQFDHLGMLYRQGRMHSEIMSFPSTEFYNNQLQIFDESKESNQNIPLENKYTKLTETEISKKLSDNRKIFINSENNNTSSSLKRNPHEAHIIAKIVNELTNLYQINSLDWDLNTCGIITPFRVQISTIHEALKDIGLQELPITIDTVERYQGGARDIIIISTCISLPQQIEQISSLNYQGIDRKLNVALTRARQQIIVVGNKKALSASETYSKLIGEYEEIKI